MENSPMFVCTEILSSGWMKRSLRSSWTNALILSKESSKSWLVEYLSIFLDFCCTRSPTELRLLSIRETTSQDSSIISYHWTKKCSFLVSKLIVFLTSPEKGGQISLWQFDIERFINFYTLAVQTRRIVPVICYTRFWSMPKSHWESKHVDYDKISRKRQVQVAYTTMPSQIAS